MRGDVEKPPVVGLAMHLQQQPAQILEQAHTHRFVIDEGAGLAVGGQTAAEHDLAVVRHRLILQKPPRAMLGSRIKHSGGRALRRAHAARSFARVASEMR